MKRLNKAYILFWKKWKSRSHQIRQVQTKMTFVPWNCQKGNYFLLIKKATLKQIRELKAHQFQLKEVFEEIIEQTNNEVEVFVGMVKNSSLMISKNDLLSGKVKNNKKLIVNFHKDSVIAKYDVIDNTFTDNTDNTVFPFPSFSFPFFSFQFIFLLTGPPRLAIAILRASLL